MGTSSDTVSNGITLSTKGIDSSPLTIAAGGYIKDGGAGTAWTKSGGPVTTSFDRGPGAGAIAGLVRGTSILTPDGEVPIEILAIGDAVMTLSGIARAIRWIGRRAYDQRFIDDTRGFLPICVNAGALTDGAPARDLLLSPEHSLYLDGVLVPAKELINGVTVTQASVVGVIEYFHIELDEHDVIFADGVPAETFTGRDNRMVFENGGEYTALYPGEAQPPWESGRPRLVPGAPELAKLRARLLRRAAALRRGASTVPASG